MAALDYLNPAYDAEEALAAARGLVSSAGAGIQKHLDIQYRHAGQVAGQQASDVALARARAAAPELGQEFGAAAKKGAGFGAGAIMLTLLVGGLITYGATRLAK